MKIKVFVLGNPLVGIDSLPLKLIEPLSKKFPGIDFQEIDPTEDMEILGRDPVIIDTVVGIKDARIINDIGSIQNSPGFSLHDHDLGFNLKLLKKMGKIDGATIIGIPEGIPEKEALEQAEEIIRKIAH